MTERAQSEAVGFILVFALIVLAVSGLTVTGLSELREVRDAQRVDNVENSMQILASNVQDLVVGRAPVRDTELQLGSGDLAFTEPVALTVSGERATDPEQNFSYEVETRPLAYEAGGHERVVSNAGGVFRQRGHNASMVAAPAADLSPDGSTLTIVQTRRSGANAGISGTSTALVRAHRTQTDIYAVTNATYDLRVRIDSPRAGAWKRHFESRADTTCSSPGPDAVTCSFTTDGTVITVVRIDLALES